MKTNILKVILVAAFALVAGYNVYHSQKTEVVSNITLANIEALARPEGDDGGGGATITCSRSCSDGVGRCWIRSNSGYCAFTGYQADSCSC